MRSAPVLPSVPDDQPLPAEEAASAAPASEAPFSPLHTASDILVPQRIAARRAPLIASSESSVQMPVAPGLRSFSGAKELRHPLRNPETPPPTPDRFHRPWLYKDPYGPQDPRSSLNQKRKLPELKRAPKIVLPPPKMPEWSIGKPPMDAGACVLAEGLLG